MFQQSSARHRLSPLLRTLGALLAALGLALTSVSAVPAFASQGNRAHLDGEVVKHMATGQRVRVILVARGSLNALETDLHRVRVKYVLRVPIAHGLTAELTPALIDYFSRDANVQRIIFDAPVRLSAPLLDATALATVYPAVVGAAAIWGNPTAPLTGQGIGVAVIDSGITAHPDFNTRIVASRDFNPTVTGVDDAYGHGTAVSGIIAGDGTASAGRYIGIAPRANLINLRVNDGTGGAPTSSIMNAILWAVNNRDAYNIRVMNLSLSASVQESYITSPIDAAVEYAWLKGIVVVVAAGNNGPNSALYAPANDPFVITVGATDDHGSPAIASHTLATFSSYGTTQNGFSKPEVVAPGRHIVTTLAQNSSFAINYPSYLVGSQYIQLSGTSMAAPIVSGTAALYLEHNPTVRPGQFKALLLATAQPLPFIGSGAGYPQAPALIGYQGLLGNANRGIDPNNYLKVMYMQAANLQTLLSVSWDSVSWDSVSWDSIAWNAVSWGN
ncbi:MAG TPA: S8 family peptidase [Candidatus Dormibacteraeota bacterium]